MNDFSEKVRLARKGSTEAFAELYSLVYKDLYHIALYSLKNTHDASDAVSETVLDAFTSIGKLRDENAFRSWIMRILSVKIKNKQSEYYINSEELDDSILPINEFSYENTELEEALGKLDTQSRLILSMAVIEGYTSEEIADVCGLKPSSVRSRLSRIKEALRLELS